MLHDPAPLLTFEKGCVGLSMNMLHDSATLNPRLQVWWKA